MRWNRVVPGVLVALLAAASSVALAGDGGLASAYAAILRGDAATGRAEIAKIAESTPNDAEAKRVGNWLESYAQLTASREELRAKTLAWSVEQAHKAQDAGKLFLALTFAARATDYVDDVAHYAQEPWLAELTKSALVRAAELERAGQWRDALSFYVQLERIHEDDATIKDRREHAASHARLEFVYADKDAVKRRMKDVDREFVSGTIQRIRETYYREPDYKDLARGGLRNIDALTETTKLYEVFDGLANPDLRSAFLTKIALLKQEVERKETFDHRDLIRLFRDLVTANKDTVELPEELLTVEYLEGITHELDDFTSVIWPADVAEFDKLMMGEFQGVGIQLGLDEISGRLKVATPLEDSPALEAGIRAGDLIVEVDDKTTKGWTTEDAVRQITGPAGTPVTLTIFRPSIGERLVFPLKRREIHLRTVRGVSRSKEAPSTGWSYMLDTDAGIAYIQLSGFNNHSQQELSRALEEAKRQGMRGLVLDVRNNPGGLLDVAISIVGLFQARGEVVSTKGRRDPRQQFDVEGTAPFADVPLLVLVNEGSASASEILAGALQDHNRALVLGNRSFGKGSVQRVLPLKSQARLKLTTALYYLPSGRSPHKAPDARQWGVDPNYELKLMPKELMKVIELERSSSVIESDKDGSVQTLDEETRKEKLAALKDEEKQNKDEDEEPSLLSDEDITLLSADPNAAPKVDPQLETALLYMRAKLAGNLPWPRELMRTAKAPSASPAQP